MTITWTIYFCPGHWLGLYGRLGNKSQDEVQQIESQQPTLWLYIQFIEANWQLKAQLTKTGLQPEDSPDHASWEEEKQRASLMHVMYTDYLYMNTGMVFLFLVNFETPCGAMFFIPVIVLAKALAPRLWYHTN